jgi:hypothetical protein
MRNIYVHPHDAPSLGSLLSTGWLSVEHAKQLAEAIAARKTIVVAGGKRRERPVSGQGKARPLTPCRACWPDIGKAAVAVLQ